MKTKALILAIIVTTGCDGVAVNIAAKAERGAADRPVDSAPVVDAGPPPGASFASSSGGRERNEITIPEPLRIVGTWVPSGYMGDAIAPDGPLKRRVADEANLPQGELVEEWVYTPSDANSRQGWVAVSYQHPADNFGDRPGKNLTDKSFRQVTFLARCRSDRGLWVSFKSGGCTAPAARYPASFESNALMVHVANEWKRYTIVLPARANASNVPNAFVLTIERSLNRHGGVLELSSLQFE